MAKFLFMQVLILGFTLNFKTTTLVSADPKFPCYFVFGDSLVDSGNNNHLNTVAKVDYLPYGIDFPFGPTGRFTNGKTIADIIGELLGFENYIPPYATASKQDLMTGVNYASGAAGILDETGYQMGTVISLNKQLSNHKAVISRIATLLGVGGERFAKKHLRKCIYTVAMGSNDYLNNYYLPEYYSSSSLYTPDQFASILIRQYSKQLRRLYRYGARKVAVFTLGKLGCCPAEVALYGANESMCVDKINDAAEIFNEKLKKLVDRLNFLFFDANFLYTDTTVESFGNITVLNRPCCGLNDIGHCEVGSATCSNRDDYIFWDGFHTTEATNSIYAKKAYEEISPLFAKVVDVA